jgi:hypothetical protein
MAISGQPVISRETRRLLITIVLAVTALWVLARIRFQDRPATSTPVPNVLAQLRPASSYTDLARVIVDIRPLITTAVSVTESGTPALRIRSDAAVTMMPRRADTAIAFDRATGLAIVPSPDGDVPGLMPWVPRLLDYPRYLVSAEAVGQHIALRPVFVGGLFAVTSALWSGDVWMLPSSAPIAPGTFVFTTDGAFAGLGTRHDDQPAIVPAALLLTAIERLQARTGEPGDIGIAVEPLSTSIASATGTSTGVVVTAVDGASAAAGRVVATEVIEAIDGEAIYTLDHWRARMARITAGGTVTLRVRGKSGMRDEAIAAGPLVAPPAPPDDPSLGLRLRSIAKVGAEVVSVQPGSRAARAGIRPGDVITVLDGEPSPTPAQLTRAFTALPERGSLLVAVARGTERHVVAIAK